MTPDRWRLVEQIFNDAVDLPEAERAEYLDRQCGLDTDLRTEIEILLAKDASPDSSLQAIIGEQAVSFSNDKSDGLTGNTLGPYTIIRKIGSGGMGSVYLAQDTRLQREVALKLLPKSFSSDVDRLRRFQLEARAASAINHPNIITIHEVERIDDVYFIVSEYVEGETLADKIGGKGLPLSDVVSLSLQMTEGLAEAHRLGVVHRDIKPRNIMITDRGVVKILDFGLAKIFESGKKEIRRESGKTATGIIVGTVEYMSPEQATGKPVDIRTDIFSLGVLMFEMCTGELPFPGETTMQSLQNIIHSEPEPISKFKKDIPYEFDRIVRKCLEKDPDRRYQSAREIAVDLSNLKRAMDSGQKMISTPRPRVAPPDSRSRLVSYIASALLVLLIALFGLVYFFRPQTPETKTLRFAILPPEKSDFVGSMQLSPDGSRLAFVAKTSDRNASLWIRSLESALPQRLQNTEGASDPFWSPDGRYIAFFADGKLKKIKASGGLAEDICDALDPRGGTWGSRNTILLSPGGGDVIYRVTPDGANFHPVTRLDASKKEESHRWPSFLPDGHHFLYVSKGDKTLLNTADLDSTQTRVLGPVDSVALPARDYLLFLRGPTLVAQRFDFGSQSLSGVTIPVAPDVWTSADIYGLSSFSVSQNNNVMVYRPGNAEATELHFYDRAGRDLGAVGSAGSHMEPFFAPDEKHVVFRRNHDLWMLDLLQNNYSRFTFDPSDDVTMVWSPDGNEIVFGSNRSGSYDLYRKPASGSSQEQLLFKSSQTKYPDDWSPDGEWILFESVDPVSKFDLWALPVKKQGPPILFQKSPANELHAQFSPDGHWVAYVSDETGQTEVYVRPFSSDKGGKWQISSHGGDQPFWNSNGKELFFLGLDNRLMSVAIDGLPSDFRPGSPRALFSVRTTPPGIPGSRGNYLPAADGQKFLVNALVSDPASSVINVILNWTAELESK